MLRVTFLGTSGSTPTKERNLPSVAIEYNGSVYLFDCGEGTQRQMMLYSVNHARVKAIFLSHVHGDHSIGIAGLVRTLALNRRTAPLEIYIPKGQEKWIKPLLDFDRALMSYPIVIKPIKPGKLYKGNNFTIGAFRLRHNIDTYGFVFKENEQLHFIKEKFRHLGIKGEMFSELIKKKEIVINNKKIHLKDITTTEAGRSVIYATDTRPAPGTVKAARDANLLIHEATFAKSGNEFARKRMHTSADEAATIAKKAGAKRLVLTHISARYKDAAELLRDARAIFQNTDAAKDGMAIEL